MNILLVEDDPFTTVVLLRVLTQLNHRVTTARNGDEALDLLIENTYGIIISDWMMPEMDGITATQEIRKILKFKKLPIISLTAKAMKGSGND